MPVPKKAAVRRADRGAAGRARVDERAKVGNGAPAGMRAGAPFGAIRQRPIGADASGKFALVQLDRSMT